MAPTTIAIHKHPGGMDPISPLPVRVNDFPKSKIPSPNNTRTRNTRFLSGKSANKQDKELEDLKSKYEETKVQMEEMKRQKNENNKRLLEMSGLVKSLQGIPVNYDKSAEGNNFVNVQRKIEAIMYEMDQAKKRYDELKNEKWFQSDTIRLQDDQIAQMEGQIKLLNERLQKEELEQKEKQNKAVDEQMANTEELEQQVMLQEMEIMNLTAEIEQLRQNKKNDIGDKIKEQEASNADKYAQIQKMEEQLANMQKEQEAFKLQQANIVEKHAEEQSEFVAKPTSETYAEINKLQDDIANLRLQQESIRKAQKSKPAISKSQPWNQDLVEKEGIVDKKTELEVVANIDIDCVFEDPVADSQSDNEAQNPLSLPTLDDTSQGKKTESTFEASADRSVASTNSQSLESIFEENENSDPVGIKKTKTLDSNSDTSATGDSSATSSYVSSKIATKLSMSDDDISSKVSSVSANNVEVEIIKTEDGSIEAITCTKPALEKSPSRESDEGSFSSESSRSAESSTASSLGWHSSDVSTQSSSRSILEQIPEEEETNDSDAESNDAKPVVDQETKELQTGSLILRKQLKESGIKYEKLMVDYKQSISKSQLQIEKLQEENQKLRDDKGAKLKDMARDSEEEQKSRWLKQENKMLLTSMEKQNQVLDKANRNYNKLQNEHSATLAMLDEKNKRYDKLILDFSNLAGTGKNSEDYNRLKALHQTVVLKLADMGEDNDRLEKERDAAIDALENKDVKLRAFDEAIASLNKTEYDLKMLENVHGETIVELQQLSDKNKELKVLYEKELASSKDSEKIRQDYIKAKTDLEMLTASNKDFSGIQEKLNASEVKVAMLEDEDKKLKEKLVATKQKSKTRADQLKDVISQYKALKTEYSEKSSELDRIKVAASGLDTGKGLQEMQKLKKEAEEAKRGKKAREKDLKIVLQHYEKLQQKYEKIRAELDSKSPDASSIGSSVKEEKKEENKDEDYVATEAEILKLEQLLKESKESATSKDGKIAQTLSELKVAKEVIATLETEKKAMESELSEVKSKLLLARKEAENAAEKQDNGQGRLRDAIAKHHQLQQVYDSLLKKFGAAKAELSKAQNDIKVKEEEEKHARKRAETVQTQYKKLQEDHDVVVQRLEKLKEEMAANTDQTIAEC